LAELAGLSTRSIQRIERGRNGSIETLNALAAVFEVDLSVLNNGGDPMNSATEVTADEKEAIEYVRGIKEFYTHVLMFVVFAIVFPFVFGMSFGFGNPVVRLMLLGFAGWGVGVIVHGLSAYEVIDLFGANWERRLIEQRLGRKL
jgi:transcriptional regulator with XRE-family HTH domain